MPQRGLRAQSCMWGDVMRLICLWLVVSVLAGTGYAQAGTIEIQNTSAVDVTETYVSLSSSPVWGPNLGGIAALSTATFAVAGGDFYDIKVVFANTDEMTVTGFWVGIGATVREKVCIFADNCDGSGGGGGGGGGDDDGGCSATANPATAAIILVLLAGLLFFSRKSRSQPGIGRHVG